MHLYHWTALISLKLLISPLRPLLTKTALLWYPWPYIVLDQVFPY